jgi:hypothetical protein
LTYNLTGTLDSLTLLDETIGTEQDDTDLAGLEVHAHTLDTGGEPGRMVSYHVVLVEADSFGTYSTSSSAWTLAMP